MIKYLLIFLLGISRLYAQAPLQFNKRFVESEDRWVALGSKNEGAYSYGFIYVDEQAGLTLNLEGSFTISPQGQFVPEKIKENVKVRLQPNQVRVAWIPANRLAELQIPARPEWLKYYKADTTSVKHLYRWGYLYNAWGESAQALPYLQRATALEPQHPGLAAELGFTYNALGRYAEAVAALTPGLTAHSTDCYTYKELSYAQIQLGQLTQAETTSTEALKYCADRGMKAEIAFNLAGHYYRQHDGNNFRRWAAEARKSTTKGDQYDVNMSKMEAKLR